MTMSQPDALAELRAHRPVAPAEVRERVRSIAAAAPGPSRRYRPTWRRAALVVAPAAVALIAAAIALHSGEPRQQVERGGAATVVETLAPATKGLDRAVAPAPSRTRLQDYDAFLRLRVGDGEAVSDATKRALVIARSLGGFPVSVSVDVGGAGGDATLRLRVPIGRVQEAVARLSALGTILGEQVRIRDVQAGANAVDRRIARLQRRLRELRADPQTDETKRQIDALTREVERLQRGRATAVRQARLATVSVELTTREPVAPETSDHGPLHGAWTALTWVGIAALYGLIVGGPFVALAVAGWLVWRLGRRRAEARLLDRP